LENLVNKRNQSWLNIRIGAFTAVLRP